jgi:hypothetical protein
MSAEIFVPYIGTQPATVSINGHKLVILSHDREQLEDHLELVGADRIFALDEEQFDSPVEVMQGLAAQAGAGIVMSPPEFDLPQVLEQLRSSLPWPH